MGQGVDSYSYVGAGVANAPMGTGDGVGVRSPEENAKPLLSPMIFWTYVINDGMTCRGGTEHLSLRR